MTHQQFVNVQNLKVVSFFSFSKYSSFLLKSSLGPLFISLKRMSSGDTDYWFLYRVNPSLYFRRWSHWEYGYQNEHRLHEVYRRSVRGYQSRDHARMSNSLSTPFNVTNPHHHHPPSLFNHTTSNANLPTTILSGMKLSRKLRNVKKSDQIENKEERKNAVGKRQKQNIVDYHETSKRRFRRSRHERYLEYRRRRLRGSLLVHCSTVELH